MRESSRTKTGKIAAYGGKAGDVSDYEPGGDGASGGTAEKAVKSTLRRHEKENKPHLTCAQTALEALGRWEADGGEGMEEARKCNVTVTLPALLPSPPHGHFSVKLSS